MLGRVLLHRELGLVTAAIISSPYRKLAHGHLVVRPGVVSSPEILGSISGYVYLWKYRLERCKLHSASWVQLKTRNSKGANCQNEHFEVQYYQRNKFLYYPIPYFIYFIYSIYIYTHWIQQNISNLKITQPGNMLYGPIDSIGQLESTRNTIRN